MPSVSAAARDSPTKAMPFSGPSGGFHGVEASDLGEVERVFVVRGGRRRGVEPVVERPHPEELGLLAGADQDAMVGTVERRRPAAEMDVRVEGDGVVVGMVGGLAAGVEKHAFEAAGRPFWSARARRRDRGPRPANAERRGIGDPRHTSLARAAPAPPELRRQSILRAAPRRLPASPLIGPSPLPLPPTEGMGAAPSTLRVRPPKLAPGWRSGSWQAKATRCLPGRPRREH